MEGVAQEAVSLAGNLKLKKLILLYDSNSVTISLTFNASLNDASSSFESTLECAADVPSF